LDARRTVLYYGEKTSPDTPGDQNSRYYVASATTVLQVVDGAQEACDFLLAQHDGKLLCLTAGGDVVLDNPRPFEGGVVEKSERGDGDYDGTGCEVSFLGQRNPGFRRWPPVPIWAAPPES
jgi:hypothetical protein